MKSSTIDILPMALGIIAIGMAMLGIFEEKRQAKLTISLRFSSTELQDKKECLSKIEKLLELDGVTLGIHYQLASGSRQS